MEDYSSDGSEERVEVTKAKAKRTRTVKEKENEPKAKVRKVKDPNAPKRPLSSFFVFSSEQRPIFKETHPELKLTEVARELGKLWKSLGPAEKKKYELLADQDKKRYANELAAYERSQAPTY